MKGRTMYDVVPEKVSGLSLVCELSAPAVSMSMRGDILVIECNNGVTHIMTERMVNQLTNERERE